MPNLCPVRHNSQKFEVSSTPLCVVVAVTTETLRKLNTRRVAQHTTIHRQWLKECSRPLCRRDEREGEERESR